MSYMNNSELKKIVSQLATLSFNDKCIEIMTVYQELDVSEDEFYILFGESENEDFDIKIPKCKINNITKRNDSIVIGLLNNKELIITCENGLDNIDDIPT